ncbi:MAG TPA: FxLYD domain-containing protein [Bacillota bacterium]|jgi:hypothetical protein|nr:hypothetical protein [Peptococcaceae bacterium]HPU35518.1 FxLYD domain-containing protein [Bacillota bacterium]HPZ43229.1 FxLYD domain-containing protein [Bacillota bacterium]HUM58423.1 FxLYD domain-containing protein [Bacillota bacterium]
MFMKSFRRVIIAAVLIFSFPIWSFASNGGPTITINGSKLNLTGVIQNGQLLVPLEELIQALGGSYIWDPVVKTATISIPGLSWPPGSDLKDSCTIEVTKITEGISLLILTGEVKNTSPYQLTSITVYGKLLDEKGEELTRSFTYKLIPAQLLPGETGSFEIIFWDYNKYKDSNARYAVYVQGFSTEVN